MNDEPPIEDMTRAVYELSQLLGRFKARVVNGNTDRTRLCTYMQEIADLAAAFADGIATGDFPELLTD